MKESDDFSVSRADIQNDPSVLIGLTLTYAGVRRVYTVCGGHISPFLKGCTDVGIDIVSGRDERTLAYAASMEAALTGHPGTIVCTAGPGVAYTSAAVKNAYYKNMPMVVLSGTTATSLRGHGSLQDSDQMGDLRRFTKYCVNISRARDIPEQLSGLYRTALSGLPGPVYGELAMDAGYPHELVEKWYGDAVRKSNFLIRWMAERRVQRLQGLPENIRIPVNQPSETLPALADIKRVTGYIKSARRPVILLGGQVALSPWRADINNAIRILEIPCFVNDLARGMVSYNNEMLFSRSRGVALNEADLVILAGIPPDFRLKYGTWGGGISRKSKVIRIDLAPEYLKCNLKPAFAVRAEPGAFLCHLTGHASPAAANREPADDWHQKLKAIEFAKVRQDTELMEKEEETQMKKIHPVRLGRILEEFLAARQNVKRIVIGDGGDFTAIVARELKSYDAWLDAGPFGSLGGGTGFALAAAEAEPDACIVVIFGDGAFSYSAMEYHTLAARKHGVIGIIGNNQGWEQIRRSDMETYGQTTTATSLPDASYELLVEGLGGYGYSARTPEDFKLALGLAYNASRGGIPSVINARISGTKARDGSLAV